MDFRIRQEHRGSIPLLRVHGELDILSAPRLLDIVQDLMGNGAESIAFDFSQVSFIDSSGLSVLVSAKRRANERGGTVYVLGVTGQIQRLLNVIQVGNQFCLCSESDLPVA